MLSELKHTHRGFRYYEFEDRNGHKCTLQKSSVAIEDCIWLGLEDADPQCLHGDAQNLGVETNATCGWVKYPIPEEVSLNTRMHLNREQAGILAKQLSFFAETGELPILPRT